MAQDDQVFLKGASLKQLKQLFGSTCRVKVHRCEIPVAENNASPNPSTNTSAAEVPTDSRIVTKVEEDSETGSSSCSEDEEVKLVPTPTPPPVPTLKKRALTKKNNGKKTIYQQIPVRCSICKKTLSSKYSLKRHMSKHNTENSDKRYRCKNCGMGFWFRSVFIHHKKLRNQRKGVCPRRYKKVRQEWRPRDTWKCHICGESIKSVTNYAIHMKIHPGESVKPFKCGNCGKEFKKKDRLSRHNLIHRGVWQFSCVFCDKGFHQKSNYCRHLRVHTEEKPYFCVVDQCGASFRHLEGLKYHRRSIHLKKY